MTGTRDHSARPSTVLWRKTRATRPLTQRSRLRATSFRGHARSSVTSQAGSPTSLLRPDPGYQVHSTVRSNAGAEGLILWSDHSAARPSLSPATTERSSVMRATEAGRVDRVEGGSTGAELRVVRPISRQQRLAVSERPSRAAYCKIRVSISASEVGRSYR